MKIKKVLGLSAIVLTISLLVLSCSSDNDNDGGDPTAPLTSIDLKANVDGPMVGVEQTLTFVVTGNDNEDYTSSSTISVNGTPISGSEYNFSEGGNYVFVATYDNLTSNELVFNATSEKYMTVSTSKALTGQQVEFNLYNSDGSNANNDAEFFVNGSAVSGNTFMSNDTGDYEVYAKYDNGLSETETHSFEVFVPKRKVSYEDYTGTWCGWCPRVTTSIQKLKEASDDVVIVAIHNGDAMQFPQEAQLRSRYGVSGFPTAKLNRSTNVPYPEDGTGAINFVLNQAGVDTNLSIAIDTELNGDMLSVTARVISTEEIPSDYKIVTYVLQNGLVYPQANYYNNQPSSPWYGMGAWITGFVHDDVLEVSLTNIFGDEVAATPAYEEYSVSYDAVNLSSYGVDNTNNSYDPHKFSVAVYVVEMFNGRERTINAQHVKAGESVGFE